MFPGTVITSFPDTWSVGANYNLKNIVLKDIDQNKTRFPIQSVEDLVNFIIKFCIDFFKRNGPGEIGFQDCFQSSINDIVCHVLTQVQSGC